MATTSRSGRIIVQGHELAIFECEDNVADLSDFASENNHLVRGFLVGMRFRVIRKVAECPWMDEIGKGRHDPLGIGGG